MIDCDDIKRIAGEKWLHRHQGYYLPTADEEILDFRTAYLMNDCKALHLRAK